MLFSKANLLVGKVASRIKEDAALNCVHFTGDGASVASNGRCLMAVGPLDVEELHFPEVGGEDVAIGTSGVSVGLDIVDTALKNLPKGDKRVSVQCAKMTKCDSAKVEFTTVGPRKEQRVAGRPVRERFPRWRGIFARMRAKAKAGRVCMKRKDLIELLGAMDDASGGGDGMVFMEFGTGEDGVVLRSVNERTGQHVIGVGMPVNTRGEWVRSDRWEKGVFGIKTKRRLSEGL